MILRQLKLFLCFLQVNGEVANNEGKIDQWEQINGSKELRTYDVMQVSEHWSSLTKVWKL